VVNMTSGLAKLALFAALVVLGIIFVPDDFVKRVEREVISAKDYLQSEAQKRFPNVERDISAQFAETKNDLDRLYQSFKEKTLPAAAKWISDHRLERQ